MTRKKFHYTPKPWLAKRTGRGTNNWVIEAPSPHVPGKWQTVCELNGPWDEKNYAANARLIESAPDLFDFVKVYLQARESNDFTSVDEMADELLKQVYAGKQPQKG